MVSVGFLAAALAASFYEFRRIFRPRQRRKNRRLPLGSKRVLPDPAMQFTVWKCFSLLQWTARHVGKLQGQFEQVGSLQILATALGQVAELVHDAQYAVVAGFGVLHITRCRHLSGDETGMHVEGIQHSGKVRRKPLVTQSRFLDRVLTTANISGMKPCSMFQPTTQWVSAHTGI